MTRLKTLTIALAGLGLMGPIASAGTIEIQLENIQHGEGQIMIALFSDAESWQSSQSVAAQSVSVSGPHVMARFDDVPAGDYGIKLFHDVDSDGTLKTGRFGMPAEPYGFSNDAKVQFGPPKYEAAVFTVGETPVTQIITLK